MLSTLSLVSTVVQCMERTDRADPRRLDVVTSPRGALKVGTARFRRLDVWASDLCCRKAAFEEDGVDALLLPVEDEEGVAVAVVDNVVWIDGVGLCHRPPPPPAVVV